MSELFHLALELLSVAPQHFLLPALFDALSVIALLGKLLLAFGQLLELLERLVNIVLAGAYLLKGDDKLHTNSYRLAERMYHKALRYAKASAQDELTAVCLFELGAALGLQEKDDPALRCFNEALRLRPEYAEAYYNRGNVYDDKAKYDKAIADFTMALSIDPLHLKAYNNRGFAYASKGDYDNAIADFSQALELNPSYDEAQKNREVAYYYKNGVLKSK